MKKLFILIFLVSVSAMSFAGNASMFSYDADELNTEFSELQVMETMIITNQNLTITDFEQMDADWLSYIDLGAMKTASPIQAMFGIDDVDWMSFAWGFCCCPVGFFIVVLDDDKSKDEKLSFWIGVGVSFVLSLISGATSGV